MRHLLTLVLFLVFATSNIFAQNMKVKNLPNYDNRLWHFGFTVGINNLGFRTVMAEDFMGMKDIYGVDFKKNTGFHLGPLSNLRLCRYVDLRMMFYLSFNQRDMQIYYKDIEGEKSVIKTRDMQISSTMLEVPVMFKFKGERINNISPYVVAGGAFRYDLSAGKNPDDDECIRLKNIDPCITGGIGLDMYLKYFKLAVELKYSLGILETLDPAGSSYSSAIKSLKSNAMTLSIHIE